MQSTPIIGGSQPSQRSRNRGVGSSEPNSLDCPFSPVYGDSVPGVDAGGRFRVNEDEGWTRRARSTMETIATLPAPTQDSVGVAVRGLVSQTPTRISSSTPRVNAARRVVGAQKPPSSSATVVPCWNCVANALSPHANPSACGAGSARTNAMRSSRAGSSRPVDHLLTGHLRGPAATSPLSGSRVGTENTKAPERPPRPSWALVIVMLRQRLLDHGKQVTHGQDQVFLTRRT